MFFRIQYGFWWQTQMTPLWWLTRYPLGNSSTSVLHKLWGSGGSWISVSIEDNLFKCLSQCQESLLPFYLLHTTWEVLEKNNCVYFLEANAYLICASSVWFRLSCWKRTQNSLQQLQRGTELLCFTGSTALIALSKPFSVGFGRTTSQQRCVEV